MTQICLLIFIVTYAGIAVGGVPGLTLDRTGVALIGAIAMVVAGVVPLREAMASIDAPTLLLLFGLMIVSAQLRLSGFYAGVALRLARVAARPRQFLLVLMAASAGLSAILVNDIVCLAFTPIVAAATLQAGRNPVPFLLGLAMASNIGSAATIIGNPQNMLIGQVGKLGFGPFLGWCLVPTLLSLAAAYGMLVWMYRGRFDGPSGVPKSPVGPVVPADERSSDRWQSRKGLFAAAVAVALFFSPIPREVTALAVGGCLLISRRTDTRRLLALVDWHLITLFCALFVVVAGLETTGLPGRLVAWMQGQGLRVGNPLALTGLAALLSNLVSNVPAVMLLLRFLDAGQTEAWYVLALASTFAGNLITIGSIANLIVIEQARTQGVIVSFREHARSGVPITLVSLVITVVWAWLV
jgi:Na+/H+ antiporter NhaD/arsenite permease-like protein